MSNASYIGINDLVEQEKGPIWVINTSNEKYQGGAEVYITIGSDVLVVPRTWLPFEMTKKLPRKSILESTYFVSAMSDGLIKAISKETALKLLAEPRASKEAKRLEEIEEAVKAATQARGIGKNVLITTGDEDRDAEYAKQSANAIAKTVSESGGNMKASGSFSLGDDEETADPISANFKAWVVKVNNIEDEDEAYSEVRNRGTMTMEEAEYLMKHVTHDVISSGIAKRMKKLAEEA